MKKFIITLTALMALTASIQAGFFSSVQGMTMKEFKPTFAYTIDTNGVNPRVYEFTPQSDPTMSCVIVFSSSDESSAPTMQCFRKNVVK